VQLEPEGDDAEAAYINLGNVYAESGEMSKAVLMHKKAIAINPQSYSAHSNLALVFLNMEEYESAYALYLEMALEFDRDILLMAADHFTMRGQERLASDMMDTYNKGPETD